MNIIKVIYILILAVIAAIGIKTVNEKQTPPSDFWLRNIEALANEEGQNQYLCLGEGNVTCPVTGKGVEAVYTLSK